MLRESLSARERTTSANPPSRRERVCIGVAAGKGAGDGMAEVGHKHQHQRAFALQQVPEAVLGTVGGIVHKEGELVPNAQYAPPTAIAPLSPKI